MPSLRSFTRMTSLRSVILVGGEKEQKWRIAIFTAQNQMAAPFPNVSFSAKSKQASFFCSRYILSLRSVLGIKKGAFSPFFVILRRVRDSNPRTCYSQQFSRLPHSTALPTLRGKCRKGNPIMQKILVFIGLKQLL